MSPEDKLFSHVLALRRALESFIGLSLAQLPEQLVRNFLSDMKHNMRNFPPPNTGDDDRDKRQAAICRHAAEIMDELSEKISDIEKQCRHQMSSRS